VVTFANPVTVNSNFQADVVKGTGVVGAGGVSSNGAISVSGNIVTIPLTGVANAQTLEVMLFNVSDGSGAGDLRLPMSVLIGDIGGNGTVSGSDISEVKARASGPVDANTFRNDVVVTGSINATDISIVKASSGTQLPPAQSEEATAQRSADAEPASRSLSR
jgi:hypothetical protein